MYFMPIARKCIIFSLKYFYLGIQMQKVYYQFIDCFNTYHMLFIKNMGTQNLSSLQNFFPHFYML